jgi:hypothetical protein
VDQRLKKDPGVGLRSRERVNRIQVEDLRSQVPRGSAAPKNGSGSREARLTVRTPGRGRHVDESLDDPIDQSVLKETRMANPTVGELQAQLEKERASTMVSDEMALASPSSSMVLQIADEGIIRCGPEDSKTRSWPGWGWSSTRPREFALGEHPKEEAHKKLSITPRS